MKIKRIIDVEVNRASEGLRVAEDLIRFIFKNENIAKKLKQIRSQIRTTFSGFEIYRDSQNDIGRKPEYDVKKNKNTKELILSNLKRDEESMRVIEEISIENRETAKNIRFQIYDIEKEIVHKVLRTFNPSVYLITPPHTPTDELIKILEDVLVDGVGVLQLRRKGLSDRQLYGEAKEIREMCRERGITFIINDRPDIAEIVEADGVHLGEDDLDVGEVRKHFPDLIIGATAQTPEKAKKLEDKGADYIGCGAVFRSPTKPDRKVIGLEGLKKVVDEVSIPVVGIGGIKPENAVEVIRTGAKGVAVIESVFGSKNPKEAVKKIINQIQNFTETADIPPIERV